MFKTDDLIKIKGYAKDLNGKTATVVRVDGAYVFVQLTEDKDQVIELLDVEVELVNRPNPKPYPELGNLIGGVRVETEKTLKNGTPFYGKDSRLNRDKTTGLDYLVSSVGWGDIDVTPAHEINYIFLEYPGIFAPTEQKEFVDFLRRSKQVETLSLFTLHWIDGILKTARSKDPWETIKPRIVERARMVLAILKEDLIIDKGLFDVICFSLDKQ